MSRRYFRVSQEQSADTRRRRMLTTALGDVERSLTPWRFVESMRWRVFGWLISECDIPSWADRGLFDVVLRRGRNTWDVREMVEVNRDGSIESRDYVWCEFEVSLKWRGRLTGEFVKVDWSKEDGFGSLSYWDKKSVEKLFARLAPPEESGLLVEEDL